MFLIYKGVYYGTNEDTFTFLRWKIVIHGGIDGYSRRIAYLGASNNNRAQQFLTCFVNVGGLLELGWTRGEKTCTGNVNGQRNQ